MNALSGLESRQPTADVQDLCNVNEVRLLADKQAPITISFLSDADHHSAHYDGTLT